MMVTLVFLSPRTLFFPLSPTLSFSLSPTLSVATSQPPDEEGRFLSLSLSLSPENIDYHFWYSDFRFRKSDFGTPKIVLRKSDFGTPIKNIYRCSFPIKNIYRFSFPIFDFWSEIQLKKMEAGGNELLNSFLAKFIKKPK